MRASPSYTHYYPRTYSAPQLVDDAIIKIDGNLSKPVWQQAPWSDLFDDIRGPDDVPNDNERPPDTCSTKFKMLWGKTHLYIGALLEADAEYPVVTSFRRRNDPIYQQDSDFEVFIDPFGTNHDYKEFEVNAWNTVWNLMLDKPYVDGGVEHSGRIAQPGDVLYYDVKQQESATMLLEGNVNACSKTKWSIEIAMAYSDIFAIPSTAGKVEVQQQQQQRQQLSNDEAPKIGSRWRINFSRVERKGIINWTWQPQIEWNAQEHKYKGEVNMHMPNGWGYLIFAGPSQRTKEDEEGIVVDIERDPEWPIRIGAMNIYAAQHAYKKENGAFTNQVDDFRPWCDADLMELFPKVVIDLTAPDGFTATIHDTKYTAQIRHDRYIHVERLLSSQ